MVIYMMLGILAILAFLCVSQALPDMLQRTRSRSSSVRQSKTVPSPRAQSPGL